MKTVNGIHVAIIPDGNRRWAKERGLMPWKGHEEAQNALRAISDFCRNDPRVSVLTLWLFSTENWKRDSEEVHQLMKMMEKLLQKERKRWKKQQTRIVHSGRTDRIPAGLAQLLKDAAAETAEFSDFTVHIALDYGGRDEVVRAVRRQLQEGNAEVTEASIRSRLDQPELPDIDVIIRTSGEQRTSNFFLWQSAYAEWVFLDTYLPDLKVSDVEKAIEDFGQRGRRFGG